MTAGSRVLGVDGCTGGWICALVDPADPQRPVDWRLLDDASAVVRLAADCAATAIDMPIGLPEDGPRTCDVQTRRLLGPRRSSVFPAPVRAVLGATSYRDACTRSRQASGRALPLQTWHLLPRIAALDAALDTNRQRHIVEAHPELSFSLLAGAPLPAKKQPDGRAARIHALGAWLPGVDMLVRRAPRPARPDDALDALAVAWTAARWAEGTACVIPEAPSYDARGLRMEIVA